MSICIAGICRGANAIVTVSDRMISLSGYASGDDVTRKIEALGANWTVMLAGDDISPAVPILERLRDMADATLQEVSDKVKKSYKVQLKIVGEDTVLKTYGYDSMETFLVDGRVQLGELVFKEAVDKLMQVQLKCDLLCAGFDVNERPHVFSECDPGQVHYYDKPGFWAIGSGEHGALSTLLSLHYDVRNDLPTCIYHVLAAKYTAETAFGVGRGTFPIVLKPNIPISGISWKMEKKCRQEWESLPRIPLGIVDEIKRDLEDEDALMKKSYGT
jgi:hypothetical protein